jgi:hypothetical protein
MLASCRLGLGVRDRSCNREQQRQTDNNDENKLHGYAPFLKKYVLVFFKVA